MPNFNTAANTYNTLPKLQQLWVDLQAKQIPAGWTAGPAFEFLVLHAFKLDGLDVHWPYTVPLYDDSEKKVVEQIDGLVWKDGICFMVEAKNLKDDVEFGVVAKLVSHVARRPSAIVGLVVSSHGFTPATKTMARFVAPQTVLLWDGAEITYGLGAPGRMRDGLTTKLGAAFKFGMPDYHLVTGTLAL